MQNEKYIQLFQKFLKKKVSLSRLQTLMGWIRSQSGFSAWADNTWERSSFDMDQDVKERLFRSIQQHIKNREERPKSYIRVVSYAAIALFTLFLSTLGVYRYVEQQMQQPNMLVVVEKGQKAKVLLPDGTAVWLNSDSRLTYGERFNHKERTVFLEGEAYFEVAKDAERLFTVQSRDLKVEALGTHFNVRAYAMENEYTVTLLEGEVAVRVDNRESVLEPNQQTVWNPSTHSFEILNIKLAEEYIFWMKNKLMFNGRTLEEISWELERIYNICVQFDSENIKNYRFNGTLSNTSLNSILQIMSMTSPVVYHFRGDTVYLNDNKNTIKYYK